MIQNYSELKEIELYGLNVSNGVIEGFVSLNPQLKKIVIHSCKKVDDRIFQSIAGHLAQIEELDIGGGKRTNTNNVKNLSRLCKSKSFSMWGSFLLTILAAPMLEIWEINYANLPLENLSVQYCHFHDNADQFFAAISKLKNLRSFSLNYCFGLSLSNIDDICKQHREITELLLSDVLDHVLSVANLVNIIQNADKLRKFTYIYHALEDEDQEEEEAEGEGEQEGEEKDEGEARVFVGAKEFKLMVNVVQNRRHHLLLEIRSNLYDIEVPNELTKLYKKSFDLIVFED